MQTDKEFYDTVIDMLYDNIQQALPDYAHATFNDKFLSSQDGQNLINALTTRLTTQINTASANAVQKAQVKAILAELLSFCLLQFGDSGANLSKPQLKELTEHWFNMLPPEE